MKNLRSGQNNIAGNHHKPGAGEWWFSFLVKVLNFFAWDVLNIMRKVEYEKLNRNRIDFEKYNERQIGKYASAGEDKLWLRKSH